MNWNNHGYPKISFFHSSFSNISLFVLMGKVSLFLQDVAVYSCFVDRLQFYFVLFLGQHPFWSTSPSLYWLVLLRLRWCRASKEGDHTHYQLLRQSSLSYKCMLPRFRPHFIVRSLCTWRSIFPIALNPISSPASVSRITLLMLVEMQVVFSFTGICFIAFLKCPIVLKADLVPQPLSLPIWCS